jgi:type II secretory pathway component GspD/PulD (secretin)
MSQYLRLCFAILILSSSLALAQAPTGAPTAAQAPSTTIKLQVVLSKYDGDKKVSSLPYILSLVPGTSGSLRSGAEVPVPTTSVTTSADKPATTSYTLQQIGTQIDATVSPTSDGKYNLKLTVTDRFTGTLDPQSRVPNVPSFRNVVIASQAILANAETMQFTSAPTPTTNEVFKVDVTLTVGNK